MMMIMAMMKYEQKHALNMNRKLKSKFRSSADEILRHLLGMTKQDKEKNQCIRGKQDDRI
jgi:hypothetical protein